MNKNLLILDECRMENILKYAHNNIDGYSLLPYHNSVYDLYSSFPIMNKTKMRAKKDSYINRAMLKDNVVLYEKTSGTTGEPFEIPKTIGERYSSAKLIWEKRKKYGVSPTNTFFTFGGFLYRDSIPTAQRVIYDNNKVELSVFDLGKDALSDYIDILKRYSKIWFFAIPSAITILAEYIIDNKINIDNVQYVEFNGEPHFQHQIDLVKRAFNCAVGNLYGSREVWALGYSCPHGCLHVFPSVHIDTINEQGDLNTGTGESGEIIITSYLNKLCPFIKYSLGDTGIVGVKNDCACQVRGQVIEALCGRVSEYVILDNKKVGMMWSYYLIEKYNALNDCKILQFQVIQESCCVFNFILLMTGFYDEVATCDFFQREAHKLFHNVLIKTTFVAHIDYTGNKHNQFIRYSSHIP